MPTGLERKLVVNNLFDRVDQTMRRTNTLERTAVTSAGQMSRRKGGGGLPPGAIILWYGAVADIPEGWVLCDGTNGTPDLTDSFVMGAGSTYSPGDTGGSATLDWYHRHASGGYATDSDAHTHGPGTLTTGTPSDSEDATSVGGAQHATGLHTHSVTSGVTASDSHSHDVTGNSAYAGSATEDILPPYYALCYIMKL